MFGKSLHFKAQSKVNKGVAVSTMFAINVKVHKNEKFICVYMASFVFIFCIREGLLLITRLCLFHTFTITGQGNIG